MRISVSDWATDEDDVDHAVEALLRHAALAGRDAFTVGLVESRPPN